MFSSGADKNSQLVYEAQALYFKYRVIVAAEHRAIPSALMNDKLPNSGDMKFLAERIKTLRAHIVSKDANPKFVEEAAHELKKVMKTANSQIEAFNKLVPQLDTIIPITADPMFRRTFLPKESQSEAEKSTAMASATYLQQQKELESDYFISTHYNHFVDDYFHASDSKKDKVLNKLWQELIDLGNKAGVTINRPTESKKPFEELIKALSDNAEKICDKLDVIHLERKRADSTTQLSYAKIEAKNTTALLTRSMPTLPLAPTGTEKTASALKNTSSAPPSRPPPPTPSLAKPKAGWEEQKQNKDNLAPEPVDTERKVTRGPIIMGSKKI